MASHGLSAKDWRRLIGLLVVALVVIAAFRWRTDILQTMLDPKVPFQTYRPPDAPDYAQAAAWVLLPSRADAPAPGDPLADVFFVHATTYDGGRDWNGPIGDAKSRRFLTHVILPNYAAPFARVGRMFAPRYRQGSVYTELTLRDDALEARQFAYGDVRRAFDVYLARFNRNRPLVVVGVEQGGTLVDRLMREELAEHPDLKQRLAAVYVVDATVIAGGHGPTSPLPACTRPRQPRCMMAWNQAFAFDQADIRSVFERSLVWSPSDELEEVRGRAILCTNPLLGGVSDALAPANLNKGAVAASDLEWGARPAFLSRQVSTQCVDGILRVSAPRSQSLKEEGGWLDRLKEPGFNLFYADEEADAQGRVAALVGDSASPAARPEP
jgi:hypothetical protein